MRLLNWLDRVDRRLGFSREADSVDRSWVAYRGFLGPIALLLGLGTWLVSQEHWWAILLGAVAIDALAPGNVLGVADDARLFDGTYHVPTVHLASWNFTGGAKG